MPRPHGADPRVLEQRYGRQPGLELRRHDAEVDLPHREPVADRRLERDETHADVGRERREPLDEGAEQQEHDVVARGDHERTGLGLGREDALRAEQILDLLHAVAHGLGELGSERGRLEVPADADEQLVVEDVAQPRKNAAHRGLAQV